MAEEFSIRHAKKSDMEMVFNLSNDDTVRENSINKAKISWESHTSWFENRIKNTEEPFYIIEDKNGSPVAQVRFNREDNGFVISLSINKNFRGKGYGCQVIKTATQELNMYPVIAYVKTTNIPSKKSFLKAGYKFYGEKIINNEPYGTFVYDKNN